MSRHSEVREAAERLRDLADGERGYHINSVLAADIHAVLDALDGAERQVREDVADLVEDWCPSETRLVAEIRNPRAGWRGTGNGTGNPGTEK